MTEKLTCHYRAAGRCDECHNALGECGAKSRPAKVGACGYICTLPPGHEGDHVGCAGPNTICAVWPQKGKKAKKAKKPAKKFEMPDTVLSSGPCVRCGKKIMVEKNVPVTVGIGLDGTRTCPKCMAAQESRHLEFTDSGGRGITISVCSSKKEQLWVGLASDRRMLLDREKAEALAAILEVFANTGRLPKP